jgi:hypothetical protein
MQRKRNKETNGIMARRKFGEGKRSRRKTLAANCNRPFSSQAALQIGFGRYFGVLLR